MLYWRERVWEIEISQQIWSANLFKSPYLKWLEAKNLQGVFRWLFEGLLVSLVVQIWLLPLTVFYFHRVTVASVLLNLWVGFFIAIESFAAVAALFFGESQRTACSAGYQIDGNFELAFIILAETFYRGRLGEFQSSGLFGHDARRLFFVFRSHSDFDNLTQPMETV